MSSQMRAAVITAPGKAEIVRVPLPEPGPGEVRIRLEGCGVCASNLVPWSGPEWMQYPTSPGALGHEGWGVVDALGPGTEGPPPGTRVAALSFAAYAEFDLARADALVPLPSALDGMPFPGEPLGCAMNIFGRSGIAAGQTVAIVGIGFLGALLTRLATAAGARVIGISRRAVSRDLALRMGADAVVPFTGKEAAVERVRALTGGALCPVVVEAVGSQSALDLAGELVGERGRLVIAGYHQDGPRQVNMWLWNWRGIDVVNAHERKQERYMQGMRAAVDAVIGGLIDPAPLYTDVYPLERLGEALDATRDRPGGFLKALVAP